MEQQPKTEQTIQSQIDELYAQKSALLDKYGVFGGGALVNQQHQQINEKLEALGVEP